MKTTFMELVDELVEEQIEIINELIDEEIKPIIEYRAKLEREIFNKAYKELLELEEGL